MTTRQAASEMRVSYPTLNRIEKGMDCDGQTLGKLLVWLLGNGNGKASDG